MTIKDEMIRHQVFMIRYAKTQARKLKEHLRAGEAAALESFGLPSRTIRNNILNTIPYKLMVTSVLNTLTDFISYEAEFSKKRIERDLKQKLVSPNQTDLESRLYGGVIAVALTRDAKTIKTTYETYLTNKAAQYAATVSDSITQGMDYAETSARVKEATDGQFTQQLLALTGVAVLASSGWAKQEVAKVNPEIIGYEWVSVLEDNTCNYCEDQNGDIIFPEDEADFPPHSNCQCSLIPVYSDEE